MEAKKLFQRKATDKAWHDTYNFLQKCYSNMQLERYFFSFFSFAVKRKEELYTFALKHVTVMG